MEDLFKALGIFQQSVQNAAITQGIMGAKDQVDQINQSNLSALEKRQQQSQLANQLALQLTGIGADPNRVTQAVGAVAPPAIKDSKDAYQMALQTGDEQMANFANKLGQFEAKQDSASTIMAQDNQNAYDWKKTLYTTDAELRKAQMTSGRKVGDKHFAYIADLGKEFEKRAATNIEAYEKARTAKDLFNQGLKEQNPTSIQAAINMMVKASGDVGAITQADRDTFGGAQDIISRLRRIGKKSANGMPLDEDIQYLTQISELFEKNQYKYVSDKARQFARKGANMLQEDGIDEETLLPKIWGNYKRDAGPESTTAKLPAGVPDGTPLKTYKLKDGSTVRGYKVGTKIYPAG